MKIGVIGLGLMGASFAKTVIKQTNNEVYGYDIDNKVMQKAIATNTILAKLNESTAKEIDLLVVAVFPRQFKKVVSEFLPFMKDGATVIDFCGIKRNIVLDMKKLSKTYPKIYFLGGHPMAGREFSGIDHSVTTLFNKSSMILTPVVSSEQKQKELIELFLSIGFGEVVISKADLHDKNIAYTSQLCHVVSNAFILSPTASKHFGYSAGSYKDLTRVARLNAKMWAPLIIDNNDNVLEELDLLIENLGKYRQAIADKDEKRLEELLDLGNKRKIKIDKRGNK